jgi:hypothetical protein
MMLAANALRAIEEPIPTVTNSTVATRHRAMAPTAIVCPGAFLSEGTG